jgi:hypothetical protein
MNAFWQKTKTKKKKPSDYPKVQSQINVYVCKTWIQMGATTNNLYSDTRRLLPRRSGRWIHKKETPTLLLLLPHLKGHHSGKTPTVTYLDDHTAESWCDPWG